MQFYWDMVEGFYTTPFMEIFLQPRPRFQLPDAIVAILAGELEGGWAIDWRRRIFFWLMKLQGLRPLGRLFEQDALFEQVDVHGLGSLGGEA